MQTWQRYLIIYVVLSLFTGLLVTVALAALQVQWSIEEMTFFEATLRVLPIGLGLGFIVSIILTACSALYVRY
ncbi:MAG: hypothetical protein ACFFCO_01765 [Promethearchaeota archaeon]